METKNGDYYVQDTIRLADVLLAIRKKGNDTWYSIDFEGVFWGCEPNCKPEAISAFHVLWNVRKDDLNEQSEETIDFLAELLR